MGKTEKPKSWQERKQEIKHKWLSPFVYIEWLCERLSYRLGRWALLEILGYIGRLTILTSFVIGIGVYWLEAPKRKEQAENQRKAKLYQAWQVISAAQGKTGGGGREIALHDLNKENVPLVGVDLSKAHLRWLRLYMADLTEANLSGANLYKAVLIGPHLKKANLSGASISGCTFEGADLREANLSGAELYSTNLYMASLGGANLSGANLSYAYLKSAYLGKANLSGAILGYTNLHEVKGWKDVNSIEFANIYNVKNEPNGFLEWAKKKGAKIIESEEEWESLIEEWEVQFEERRRKKK